MSKLRPVVAAVIALGFYTATDILVWQRIFEANQLNVFADTYHTGWFVSLAGYAAIGVVVMSNRWKDCVFFLAALLVGAYSGLEDVLYYVLDGKALPASLPWLEGNPLIRGSTRGDLLTSVAFWLLALTLLYVVMFVAKPEADAATPAHIRERRHSSHPAR